MAKEIERKFRVIGAKIPDPANARHALIEQHYISLNEISKVVIGIKKEGEIYYFLWVPDIAYFRLSKEQCDALGGPRAIKKSEEVRVRRKGEKHTLTIKGDGTLERDEWETEISPEIYQLLIPASEGRRIVKDRYEIKLPGGEKAEFDIYRESLEGPDHMTVEVEFKGEEELAAFLKPDWFGEDITEDKRFKNKNLAAKGWPTTTKNQGILK